MSKIRVFGVALVTAASVAVLGGGVAAAEEPSTGSAELLEQLSSGTGEAEDVVEEPSTGSADGLAELLALLTSGSGEAEDVAEEPATGSAEGLDLGALLEQLTTGTAEAETE